MSIGVTTYNRPRTLLRTLTCLVSQTYDNLEVILADNCSTDPEVKGVVESFISDDRIKYFRHPVNKGAIFNFNFVLERASGQFFMRLADDDWIDVDYIEKAICFLLSNEDYIGAYGCAKIFGRDGDMIRYDSQIDFTESSPYLRVVKYFQNVRHNGTFYGVIRKEGLRYLLMRNVIAIDWIIIARVISRGKYKMLEGTNSYIMLGGASATTENLVQTFGLSNFTKLFPFLSVSLNVFLDITWASSAYSELDHFQRLKLACKCSSIVLRRFKVIKELRFGIRRLLRFG